MKKARLRKQVQSKLVGQALTARENAVLWLVIEGLSNKLIADRMALSEHTVKFHLRNAGKKIGTTSRTKAAIDFALGQGRTALARISPASEKSELAAKRDKLLEDNWIGGFAVALAEVLRYGGGHTCVCQAARAAGVTLAAAQEAGVPALHLEALKSALTP
jgi:DNA-binding CsgD family transcriptional regulator